MRMPNGSAVRRTLESAAHRVLYTLLLALVAMAVIILVVPLIRQYSGTNEQIILVAILVVLLVELVSTKLRGFVDWLLFGQRDDAAAVSSRLARELELAAEDAAVPALVAALADTLRLSYVAAFVGSGGAREAVAAVGAPSGTDKRFPVRHSGQELGELRAGRRVQGLNHQDERMLGAAAAQLGVALHAASLAVELQHARERLVTSREAERQRLRRELHDGVGPTLAGIALGLESADRALTVDRVRAGRLIRETRTDVAGLITDVRRVVDGLRPPMLDEVGLAGALTQLCVAFDARTDCQITARTGPLPTVPAAADVAAYRIGSEALTNVVRHAGATRCEVILSTDDDWLLLEVTDNGHGGASSRNGGAGLPSMFERAAELGGSVEVTSSSSGTRVRARLPLTPVDVDG
jgi:signal transduction histidine kinase